MINRFILDNRKPRKKLPCPSCNEKGKFTPYIDIETDNYLDPDSCGICDRVNICKYHLPPREFFMRNPHAKDQFNLNKPITKLVPVPKPKPDFHDISLVKKSCSLYKKTNLYSSLLKYFDKASVENVLTEYKIGLSSTWPGANVFWQIDPQNNVRAGKILLIDAETHKRVKEPYPHASWVHSRFIKKGLLDEFNLVQCLFGAHLINKDSSKTIALVESEKTAITAAIAYPQFTWLATGSVNQLKYETLKDCKDRKILVFPDLGYLDKWQSKINEISEVLNVYTEIVDILELTSSDVDIREGYDLEDFILKCIVKSKGLEREYEYPKEWDLF